MAEVVKGIAVGLAVVLQVDLIEEVVIQKVNGLRDKSLYIFMYLMSCLCHVCENDLRNAAGAVPVCFLKNSANSL